MNFLSRVRWLPLLVTIALMVLIYRAADSAMEPRPPLGFWLATLGGLALFLTLKSVRAWYVSPPKARPRKFVAWVLGYEPPVPGPYYTRAVDHLQLKDYFEPSGAVYALSIFDTPVYQEIRARWGDMSMTRRSEVTPQPGDSVLIFHVIAGELDPIPREDQLQSATIVPLLHKLARAY